MMAEDSIDELIESWAGILKCLNDGPVAAIAQREKINQYKSTCLRLLQELNHRASIIDQNRV